MKNSVAKIVRVMLLVCVAIVVNAQQEDPQFLDVQVSAQGHTTIKLLLAPVGSFIDSIAEITTILKNDFEFSGQFDVDVHSYPVVSSKSELGMLFDQGYPLVLFINELPRQKGFEWRLYDTQSASMIKGRQYHKRGKSLRGWAHNIADMVWPELTAQEGFFSTKIAYCKDTIGNNKNRCKHIYLADYNGKQEQPIIATNTITIAPRFNQDVANPLLFYSENTSSNIKLMISDMAGHKKTASNFDGVNMLPSFSKDGTKLIYCASHGHGTCQLFYYEKNNLRRLTNNSGNNVSPSLSADGLQLYFCSDYTGKPQIYCLDLGTGKQKNITQSSDACYCPAYCSKNGLLAYSKTIKGATQLFVYDTATTKHRQLTFEDGNKDECSWSPCGNYLLYGVDKSGKSRIAMYNLLTDKYHFITSEHDACSYPAWSPVYEHFPVMA